MITLSLYRHAKSSWDDSGLSDFERPLAPRGEKAAPLMGRLMADEGLEPDIVLCSAAVRARETLELTKAEWVSEPEIHFEEGLYMAGPRQMLSFLASLPESCAHAMIIGHNPGMHALAVSAVARGDAMIRVQMSEKFPTAALAVIDFDGSWLNAGAGKGTLRLFVTPRNVA